jgi:hypothetical protein
MTDSCGNVYTFTGTGAQIAPTGATATVATTAAAAASDGCGDNDGRC